MSIVKTVTDFVVIIGMCFVVYAAYKLGKD